MSRNYLNFIFHTDIRPLFDTAVNCDFPQNIIMLRLEIVHYLDWDIEIRLAGLNKFPF
jgi:hypothetical protein